MKRLCVMSNVIQLKRTIRELSYNYRGSASTFDGNYWRILEGRFDYNDIMKLAREHRLNEVSYTDKDGKYTINVKTGETTKNAPQND